MTKMSAITVNALYLPTFSAGTLIFLFDFYGTYYNEGTVALHL